MSDEKIAALEAKVALFERIIRTFAETPVIFNDWQFYPLLRELGYDPPRGAPFPERNE